MLIYPFLVILVHISTGCPVCSFAIGENAVLAIVVTLSEIEVLLKFLLVKVKNKQTVTPLSLVEQDCTYYYNCNFMTFLQWWQHFLFLRELCIGRNLISKCIKSQIQSHNFVN